LWIIISYKIIKFAVFSTKFVAKSVLYKIFYKKIDSNFLQKKFHNKIYKYFLQKKLKQN